MKIYNNANLYSLKKNNTLYEIIEKIGLQDDINKIAGVSTTIINEDTKIQEKPVYTSDIINFESYNNAPYINTEYYNPVHYLEEELIIQYYVMDYAQEDYFFDKYEKEFLVIVDFGGTILRRKVKAGNHKINLGKPSTLGETYFSIKCIDLSNNYESAKHYKHLLVVDRNTYTITTEQTYIMTEQDLSIYNIIPSTDGTKITDEQGANNILGINNMLSTIKKQGYRKIIFYNPNGDNSNRYTYYLQPYNNRNNPVIIPSGLTVDLNNSKLKQLVSYGASSLLVRFEYDAVDSHLINGYVWGDYDEHIVDKTDENYTATTQGVEGEGYNLIYLNGAFNSLENIDHGFGTGYSICSGANNNKVGDAIFDWDNVYIDSNGNDIVSDIDIWTSDYYKLTEEMKQYKFLQANPYAGYSGLCGKTNDEIIIYYDKNKYFIKSEKVRQYGLSLIPDNAEYVRFTLCSDTKEGITKQSASGFRIDCKNYKQTTCWTLKNVYSHDCRTVAYATGIFNHLYLNSCVIDNCGQWLENGRVTPLAIDIEDGYQHSESLYIYNIICLAGNKGNTIVNLVTTYDVHLYGENKCNFYSNKTFGLNIHDTSISGELYLGRMEHMRCGFMQVYNSKLGGFRSNCTANVNDPETLIQKCEIDGQVNTYGYANTQRVTFRNCIITRQPRGNIFVSSEKHISCVCNISILHYMQLNAIFKNCVLKGNGEIRISSDATNVVFTNCDIYVPYTVRANGFMKFKLCKLFNVLYNISNEHIMLNNCKIVKEA